MSPRPADPAASAPESILANVAAPLLDAKGAAEWLNVPASWLLAEARADRVPHVRLGRYVRFAPAELAAWVDGRMRGPRRRTGSRPVSAGAGSPVAAGKNGSSSARSTDLSTEGGL